VSEELGPPYTIYTDIDSVLDTRFTTYYRMDDTAIEALLVKGFSSIPYYHRVTEVTNLYDYQAYVKAYQERSTLDLAAASLCGSIEVITDLLEKAANVGESDELPCHGDLMINMYPYLLTPAEEGQLISDLLAVASLPPFTKIETIYKDPLTINQSYIKEKKIKVLLSYDGDAILESLIERYSLINNRLPKVSLLVPAIARGAVADPATLFQKNELGLGPFATMEAVLGEYIELKFVDASVFTGIIYKPFKKEAVASSVRDQTKRPKRRRR
jgi:hypothetical protein